MTANMKRYKRLQFTNYLKDVIDDTAQVRLEAEQQANQIFGKGSIWRKFEKPQVPCSKNSIVFHPSQQCTNIF
jgi:hypothetical protein